MLYQCRHRMTGTALVNWAGMAGVNDKGTVGKRSRRSVGSRLKIIGSSGSKAEGLLDVGMERLWDARDQFFRPTCVAFAVSAGVDLINLKELKAAKKEADFKRASPRWFYWHMRKQTSPNELISLPPDWSMGATKLGQARDVLVRLGYCDEEKYRYDYLDAEPGYPEGDDPPGPGAKRQAAENVAQFSERDMLYRDWPTPDGRPTSGVAELIYSHLTEKKRPVAISVPLFQWYDDLPDDPSNFDDEDVIKSGIVGTPDQKRRKIASGHSFCVYDFEPDRSEETGGWFLFKNSHGTKWGTDGPSNSGRKPSIRARGFGAISATYVEKYCWEILGL